MTHLHHVNKHTLLLISLFLDVQDLCGPSQSTSWDKRRLIDFEDLQDHDYADCAAFFQSWLCFEVLEAFFTPLKDFDLYDFVTQRGDGEWLVTTVKLDV